METFKITFKQYFELDDKSDYDFLLRYEKSYIKPVDNYSIGDLKKKSFGIVKDLQSDCNLFNIVNTLSINPNDLLFKVSQSYYYVYNELCKINELETQLLGNSYASDEQIEAGIEDFEKIGVYMQFHELTGGDVTKYETVRNTEYNVCLLELYTRKLKYDYFERFNKIILRKNKNNLH